MIIVIFIALNDTLILILKLREYWEVDMGVAFAWNSIGLKGPLLISDSNVAAIWKPVININILLRSSGKQNLLYTQNQFNSLNAAGVGVAVVGNLAEFNVVQKPFYDQNEIDVIDNFNLTLG